MTSKPTVFHHFTVDVEEAFHSTALGERVAPDRWEGLPRRSPEVVAELLDDLERRRARATFFVLGWMAEREPKLVRRISDAGHEVASHSMLHRRVVDLTPHEFRRTIRESKDLLEQITGRPVDGFRAPSFSIVPGCEWAFDVLLEEGYRYDSSLFPTRAHPSYGYPCDPSPHWIERPAGRLFELPLVTLSVLGRRLPAAGGAYLRFFPLALVRSAVRRAEAEGYAATTYIHPWDVDPEQERLELPPLLRLRLYTGLEGAKRRLPALLDAFRFRTIRETLAEAEALESSVARGRA